MCLDIDGTYYFIVEFLHIKTGKGPFRKNQTKNVTTGRILDKTWNSGVKVEEVRIERRPYQFLYKDEMDLQFYAPWTFEQISIPGETIDVQFLKRRYRRSNGSRCHWNSSYLRASGKGNTSGYHRTRKLKVTLQPTHWNLLLWKQVQKFVFLCLSQKVNLLKSTRDGSYLGRVR